MESQRNYWLGDLQVVGCFVQQVGAEGIFVGCLAQDISRLMELRSITYQRMGFVLLTSIVVPIYQSVKIRCLSPDSDCVGCFTYEVRKESIFGLGSSLWDVWLGKRSRRNS